MLEKIKELLRMTNTTQKNYHVEVEKIPWDHTFLLEALSWSKRSHDPDTKCGCVLVRDKRILSTGYNGFIRNIDDSMLPNQRPFKYDFMLHAEFNAICNCARNGVSSLGATAYITTKPCVQCFQMLWQAGINRIVYSNMGNSKHFHSIESDNKIEALMMLINQLHYVYGNKVRKELTVGFIDKEDILNA